MYEFYYNIILNVEKVQFFVEKELKNKHPAQFVLDQLEEIDCQLATSLEHQTRTNLTRMQLHARSRRVCDRKLLLNCKQAQSVTRCSPDCERE